MKEQWLEANLSREVQYSAVLYNVYVQCTVKCIHMCKKNVKFEMSA